MAQFDWGTEDDNTPWPETPAAPPQQKRSRRPLLIFVVLLTLFAGGWLYFEAQRRIEAAEEQTTREVESSFELVQRAYLENDRELFTNLLSGRNLDWLATQHEMLGTTLWYERPALGLWLTDNPLAAQPPLTITLSTDLTTAEVEAVYQYLYEPTNTPVKLIQTQVFRQGASRWLLAPLDGDAWGQKESLDFPFLTLVYPTGDQELAERLGIDLNDTLAELCGERGDLDCTGGNRPNFNIELAVDPRSLLDVERQVTRRRSDRRLVIPGPTLLGRPLSPEDYDVLLVIYSRLILMPWLEQQAADLWPGFPAQADWAVQEWLRQAGLAPPINQTRLPWPAASAPAEQLLLTCSTGKSNRLFTYTPKSGAMTPTRYKGRVMSLASSRNESLVALQIDELGYILPAARLGQPLTRFQLEPDFSSFEWQTRRDKQVLLSRQELENRGVYDLGFEVSCSGDNCLAAGIDLPPVDNIAWSPDGERVLSQRNGEIEVRGANGRAEPISFTTTSENNQNAVNGRFPYWVSNTKFRTVAGITLTGGSRVNALVTLDYFPIEPAIWVYSQIDSTPVLLEALPPEQRSGNLQIYYATPHPAFPDRRSFVLAGNPETGQLYIFLYDHRLRRANLVGASTTLYSFFISDSGGILGLVEENFVPTGKDNLRLVQLERGEVLTFDLEEQIASKIDLTADERWLMILDHGSLRIVDLETNDVTSMPAAVFGGCFDAAWVLPAG